MTARRTKIRSPESYLGLGWKVVLAHGKVPVDKDWPDLTIDKATLRKRLGDDPTLNVGVILGPRSGIIDLECDSPEAEKDVQRLFKGVRVPKCPTFQSKRGKHRLFRWDDRLDAIGRATVKYDALEVRLGGGGKGACSILPPAETDGFRREWLDSPSEVEPPKLPDKVLARLVETAKGRPRERNGNAAPGDVIPERQRDITLTGIAGAMRRRGCGEEAILTALAVENQRRCSPPLPEPQVRKIARSVAGYPPSFSSFSSFNSSGWPELAPAALSGLPGEIVNCLDEYTEADKVAVLAHLLVAFGVMVGPQPHFMVQHDRHPGRLNAVLVGDTAKARKGTAWGSVRELLAQVDPVWVTDQVATGLSSGEGLIHRVRDEEGEQIDKRVLIIEPEFATTLIAARREGCTLSGIIRQAWDDGTLSVLTRNDPLRATGTHIGIVGHITREELTKHLTATEKANGFANRLLFLLARRSKLLPDGATPPRELMERLGKRLRTAADAAHSARELRRDLQASELWHAVYQELSEGKRGLVGAVVSRAEAQVLRLSLVYALLDGSKVVKREHLESALAVWEYAEKSARIIFGETTGDSLADDIYRLLADGRKSRKEISEHFSRNRTSAEIEAALQTLQVARLAEPVEVRRHRGRPTTFWQRTTN